MKKVAVLISCYNRKEKTVGCLKSLYKAIQLLDRNFQFDIYLVDDGSTDGTSDEVNKNFPLVKIIQSKGNLYWARGMRLSWETALSSKIEYDAFLLLNDDVILAETFIEVVLQTHKFCLENYKQAGIYACSTTDPSTSKISYGGVVIKKKGIKVYKARISPSNMPIPCSLANANILMVTAAVVKSIGILDSKYVHQFADYDYTHAAFRKHIPVLLCPGIGGYCVNDHGNEWLPSGSTLKDRIKYLYSPKGLAYKEYLYYLKKNFKYQIPYYFTMLWLKTFFPFIWDKYKKSNN